MGLLNKKYEMETGGSMADCVGHQGFCPVVTNKETGETLFNTEIYKSEDVNTSQNFDNSESLDEETIAASLVLIIKKLNFIIDNLSRN